VEQFDRGARGQCRRRIPTASFRGSESEPGTQALTAARRRGAVVPEMVRDLRVNRIVARRSLDERPQVIFECR